MDSTTRWAISSWLDMGRGAYQWQRGLFIGHDLTIAGDFRRGCELVSELRLVATLTARQKALQERLGAVRVDVVTPETFGSALLYATGNLITQELKALFIRGAHCLKKP